MTTIRNLILFVSPFVSLLSNKHLVDLLVHHRRLFSFLFDDKFISFLSVDVNWLTIRAFLVTGKNQKTRRYDRWRLILIDQSYMLTFSISRKRGNFDPSSIIFLTFSFPVILLSNHWPRRSDQWTNKWQQQWTQWPYYVFPLLFFIPVDRTEREREKVAVISQHRSRAMTTNTEHTL